ncbi:hypothetical protein AKJ66_04305 [candidate division MSBL1 archaeon SCGC-AAA259E22]|uniref:NAD-dependent epimerase/dehydratase domain-containing protein n=2 Tax=candidate division MSBL1 TaxID=215777 RepID=A0A133U6G6_9EURY|nr:hypothetical protein AKJ61_02100 [candidate division MSBL1 archaeon SCGC-AAA259B11]KXA92350.1 hypothetical protein AKJ66_04305 [candidate division MSBL1 archaeon SCGC-AAA259E22]
MSRTLITGGAGFVGSNLARFIEPSVLLDWRKPGYLFEDGELIFDDAEFVKGDIRNGDDLEKCLEVGDVDSIVHLAAIPGVRKCEEEPELARSVNVGGTESVLEFARRNDVSKVVPASSAGVYGEIREQPITEEHPKDPLNLYSENKRKGEKLCREYSGSYGLDTTVLRMSNLYGPGFQVKPNLTVIPLFLLRALLNKPLTVYGDGEQTRDFVHVEDVAQGFQKVLESSDGSYRAFNLGSGETSSINELAETINELVDRLYDRNVDVEHVEMPEWRDEAKEEFDYSIDKIKREVGYEPVYSLKEGIREMIAGLF